MDVLQLAVARRAALAAEVARLDAFLDRAAMLLDSAGKRDAAAADRPLAANVLAFRRPVSPSRPGATACGTGA